VYIGVQNNAKDSAVQSDLTNIKTAVVAYQTDTQQAGMPNLDAATLGKYGFTTSGTYTPNGMVPTKATNSTATLFCISAKSTTGTIFIVSSNLGVSKLTSPATGCPAATTGW
jgi:type IV pilus assembly protein PilA